MSRYHAGRMRACEYLPEHGVCSTITLRTLYCIKLRVTFFVARYLLRWYYRSNDFHNFHKPVYARGQSPRMQMASLSHGLQRELIVIRTSSLELIGASKRGGCTGCHKYSFEIDQLSEPKAFASIVRHCSDRLFPVESRFLSCTEVIYRRIVSESQHRGCTFLEIQILSVPIRTQSSNGSGRKLAGISSWVSANRSSRISTWKSLLHRVWER